MTAATDAATTEAGTAPSDIQPAEIGRPESRAPAIRYAVIIPHYNDLTRLRLCLDSLAPQVAGRDDIEVLVVDNNSPIDMSAVPGAYPWVRLFVEPQKGAGHARNRGAAEATADTFLFTDSDCIPTSDWVARAIAAQRDDAIVGGRMETFDETPGPRSGAEAFEAVFAFNQRHYVKHLNFTVTANMITTRHVYETTGGMIFGPSEDLEWCQRAVSSGFAISYDEKMVVKHPTRRDWEALLKKWRRIVDEQYWTSSQHNGTSLAGRLRWAARAFAVSLSGLVHLPKVFACRDLENMPDKIRAAGTLLRLRVTRGVWMMRQAMSPTLE